MERKHDDRPIESWRDGIKVNPAADLLRMMSGDELKTLGEDIKAHGLHVPVTVWKKQKHSQPTLIDGRNRLDAMKSSLQHPRG